jgi:hypothetical protein
MGQLILSMQKEEGLVVGDAQRWPAAEAARERAESLLSFSTNAATLKSALAGASLTEFIGAQWLADHPSLRPALTLVLKELSGSV